MGRVFIRNLERVTVVENGINKGTKKMVQSARNVERNRVRQSWKASLRSFSNVY